MRAVVQRVARAAVVVGDETVGRIGRGLLVYVAAAPDDADADVRYLTEKIPHLRIFDDDTGKLNRSVLDLGGGVLVVSAFTVLADARQGRRPSFASSAPGTLAEPRIEQLVAGLRATGLTVATGRFAAPMQVESVNDGPICLLLDSRRVV
ncbi:MAG: D-aminoacyl-tRNA deacylase [Phycisphaerae bacterium]